MDHQNFIETITIHKGVHSSTLSPINHKLNKLIKLKCKRKKKHKIIIPNTQRICLALVPFGYA